MSRVDRVMADIERLAAACALREWAAREPEASVFGSTGNLVVVDFLGASDERKRRGTRLTRAQAKASHGTYHRNLPGSRRRWLNTCSVWTSPVVCTTIAHMKTLIVALLAVSGCTQGGKATFDDMRAAACRGDAQGFFAHIDRTSVEEALLKDVGPMGKLAARDALAEWEDDIKKGNDGSLCKMQFVSAEDRDTTAEVRWKTPSGRDKTWVFRRFDGRLLAVELIDHMAEAEAAKRRECQALIDVINKGAVEVNKGSASIAQSPLSVGAYAQLADSVDGIVLSASKVDLKLSELRGLAADYRGVMTDMAKASRAAAKAVTANDAEAVTGAAADMTKIGKREQDLIENINRFCGKGQ